MHAITSTSRESRRRDQHQPQVQSAKQKQQRPLYGLFGSNFHGMDSFYGFCHLSSSLLVMISDATASAPPPLPKGWDRCHVWMERKRRYCRQLPFAEGEKFCGNHRHLILSSSSPELKPDSETSQAATPSSQRKRIPCPIDPSHWIFEDKAAKHIENVPQTKSESDNKKSPISKKTSIAEDSVPWCNADLATETVEWAHALARRVLEVHQSIFRPQGSSCSSTRDITNLTAAEIHDALPFCDLSRPELDSGIVQAFESHHIKSGGARHVPQIASLLGHLRAMNVLPSRTTRDNDQPSWAKSSNKRPLVIIEMGAGRGMFGLAAASVANASNGGKVNLIMVERTGSRSKADTAFRNIPKDADISYMKVDGVQWSRCSCDLAHVNLPVVLQREEFRDTKIVVIAKHLCGAGTDLALKSLSSIQTRIDACIFATCCHGVCDWNQYVGRDYLRTVMEKTQNVSSEPDHPSQCGEKVSFGSAEFDLLRRWCAACSPGRASNSAPSLDDASDHPVSIPVSSSCTDNQNATSVSSVVKSLNLTCGMQGLGRACQRLIDFGRLEYLRHQIFPDPSSTVNLSHYIAPDVSPQNAILSACRSEVAKDDDGSEQT
ncbi:methyltransferase [Nitzschia inconspicua]|uniref:tRNA:m(4)X modification enzyme TRM13 n=1 Tax=Nitzschia inconspicua TaxID=303405 RepID=A0A9K3K9F2_9STRA|nr:methyltransferase [Nitzschia inconspicua]